MSTRIKICGLTDRSGVAAAVDGGADALGFVFAESVRRIAPENAAELSAQVPDGIQRVAVMLHPSRDEWRQVLGVFRPDVLQTDIADFDYLDVPEDVVRWPVIREGAAGDELPDVFVYEGVSSGAGQTVDWQGAAALAKRGRMILAGGLGADNVVRAIETVAPWGVDVSSAVESSPGQKDPEKIYAFISAARAAG